MQYSAGNGSEHLCRPKVMDALAKCSPGRARNPECVQNRQVSAGAAGRGPETFDLLVIGGGINGASIARDAAGRGLRTLLCERDDLAQHTSSASTKLIHGGLRYLAQYNFRLVRASLREREVLLRNAPHIIRPLRFVLPHHGNLRPRWLIRLGLFLYDHIGGRAQLPPCRGVRLCSHPAGAALRRNFRHGYEYSDCWVRDARLVVLAAQDACRHGAEIRTRTECVEAAWGDGHWRAVLRDRTSGARQVIGARAVVNATGPWVGSTLGMVQRTGTPSGPAVRLVKGSHIVVHKLFDHPYPYLFQSADGRVLFAIPFEEEFTLLGTTDLEAGTEPGVPSVSEAETDYILEVAGGYFERPIARSDIVWRFAGLRPLVDDRTRNASRVTRDYVLQLDSAPGPLLSVHGGKLTTCRKLAEQAVDVLAAPLGCRQPAWTRDAALPGGDVAGGDMAACAAEFSARHPWLPRTLLDRYLCHYGTSTATLLEGCRGLDDLGEDFGAGLYAAEIRYLVAQEWARTAEDILWRRTWLGLRIPDEGAARLEAFLAADRGNRYRETATAE